MSVVLCIAVHSQKLHISAVFSYYIPLYAVKIDAICILLLQNCVMLFSIDKYLLLITAKIM